MKPESSLHFIKLAHTLIWAFLAGCILAIPICGFFEQYTAAAVLIGIVLLEVFVLFANRMSCPLTAVAANYTKDRQANFDIYLPLWLAQNNKLIFGPLFVLGALSVLARWAGWLG